MSITPIVPPQNATELVAADISPYICDSFQFSKICVCFAVDQPGFMQIDDPLDAIAVHAFNGTWGVWAVGLFAAKNLVNTSYGYNPYTQGDRAYGCFLGGDGRLLAAQLVYSIWLGGEGASFLDCMCNNSTSVVHWLHYYSGKATPQRIVYLLSVWSRICRHNSLGVAQLVLV